MNFFLYFRRLVRNKFFIACSLLLLTLVLFMQLRSYADLDLIKQQQHIIHAFIAKQFWLAITLFAVLYIVVGACALPFGGILTFSGGYFFGLGYTVAVVCCGATIGAVAAFLMARYVLRDAIEHRYPSQVQWLNTELRNHGTHYLLFIRLLPFMPYFIVNPIAGLTRISLFTFTWTTAIGVMPGSAIFAFAGREFAQINSLRGIISVHTICVMSMLALLTLLPMIIQRMQMRKNKNTVETDQSVGCAD